MITRPAMEEGFPIALPQPNVSLFTGVSNLSGSLYDPAARTRRTSSSARVSSDGTLSYAPRAADAVLLRGTSRPM